MDSLSNYPNVILEGQLIRVPGEPELPAQEQRQTVEEFLDEVAMHLDMLVAKFGEDSILLASSMFVGDTKLLRLQ